MVDDVVRSPRFSGTPRRLKAVLLTGGEGVLAGGLDEVSGVVEGEDADVTRAPELEAVDAAV